MISSEDSALRCLVMVARAMDGNSAEGRRAVAQSLALALALHPANADAKKMLREWSRGEKGDPAHAASALAREAGGCLEV